MSDEVTVSVTGSGTVDVVVDASPEQSIVTATEQVVEVQELDLVGEEGPPGEEGPIGPAGPTGPAGPAGPAGISTVNTFVFRQDVPASVWTVRHGLNTYPAVTVVDSANETVLGDIAYLDANTIELEFSAPFSGTAYVI